MGDEKEDRRVQRTKDLLRRSFIQLIREKGYDAVTIQDITGKANLGRTTFYLHYQSKDDLLLDHHLVDHFQFVQMTADELLAEQYPQSYTKFLNRISDSKNVYVAITRGRDAEIIMRGVREQMTRDLREVLSEAFPSVEPAIPLDALISYIVGAQLTFIDWWMITRNTYTSEEVATILHRLQRVAVRDAYGLTS